MDKTRFELGKFYAEIAYAEATNTLTPERAAATLMTMIEAIAHDHPTENVLGLAYAAWKEAE